MAGTVTLVEETDKAFHGKVQVIRRKFIYSRLIADDEAVVITPTSGSTKNQQRGYIEAPQSQLVSVQVKNTSVLVNTPIAIFLAMSLRPPSELVADPFAGQALDTLTGENREWPNNFSTVLEYVRTYGPNSQSTGGRTWFVGFQAENAKDSSWEFTIQTKEAA